uniref:Uncharacterized protein n=1 Tax=Anopheles farauti TaxID=69004 RepID=A0A182Q4X3_9DIPT
MYAPCMVLNGVGVDVAQIGENLAPGFRTDRSLGDADGLPDAAPYELFPLGGRKLLAQHDAASEVALGECLRLPSPATMQQILVGVQFIPQEAILVRLKGAKVLAINGPPGFEVDDTNTWKCSVEKELEPSSSSSASALKRTVLTAEIAIRYQLVQVALEHLQMLGQIAFLWYATVTLVQRLGGWFLQQRRELARIVQYRDGIAAERIVGVLDDGIALRIGSREDIEQEIKVTDGGGSLLR